MKMNGKATTKTKNYEGGAAYTPSDKLELFLRFLSNYVGEPKYYVSGDKDLEDFRRALKKVMDKDPEFVAKLTIYAREQLLLRSAPTLALVEMANHPKYKGKSIVKMTGIRVLTRPDMLTEALAMQLKFYGKPIPSQLKKALAASIRRFDRYQLAKYRCDKCEVKLKDVVLLTHPKPKNGAQARDFKDLIEGRLRSERTWETIISTRGSTKEAWEEALSEWVKYKQYMALVRNLRNLVKNEVYNEDFKKALDLLRKPASNNSKLYPYHYLSAYKEVYNLLKYDEELPAAQKTMAAEILNALEDGMNEYVKSARLFEGETMVAIDTSGSMSNRLSRNSTVTRAEVATLYGIILARANNADVLTFDCNVKTFPHSGGILRTAIEHSRADGCTSAYEVLEYMMKVPKKYDNLVMLTDEQVWNWGWGKPNDLFQKHVAKYREEFNPDLRIITWDLAGYGTIYLPEHDRRNVYIGGFSPRILELLEKLSTTDEILEYIERMEIY